MPLYTEHLSLAKPTRDERYNIAVPNGNMDILDEHVQLLTEKNQLLGEEVAALREELANMANKNCPAIYDLELTSGIEIHATSQFYKTQWNQVFLHGDLFKTTGDFELREVIAQLPEGFRPLNWGRYPATFSNGMQYSEGTITVDQAGGLAIGNSGLKQNRIFFNFCFIAAV